MNKNVISSVAIASALFGIHGIKDSHASSYTTGYVNCSALNVRKSATTSSSRLGVLMRNQNVSIISKQGDWYKIIYNGSHAYIYGKYVTIKNNTANMNLNKQGYVTCSRLNVRSNSSTSSVILGKITKNQSVTIVSETQNWYKIKYNYSYGYVSKDYISLSKPHSIYNLDKFLFVGDSFTSRISYTIKEEAPNAIVCAKGGASPYHWIENFSKMPSSTSVKGVNLLIGINGVTRESNLTNTKLLIDKLVQKYPSKTIFVQKVFPIGKGYNNFTESQVNSYNNKIANFNAKIKSYCSTKSNVKFVDATSGFVNSKGQLINCDSDGLHIKWEYNHKLFKNMENAIKNS